MRRFACVCLLMGVLLAAACSDSQQSARDTRIQLAEQKFVIVSLNGTTFPSMQDQSLYVEFDEDMGLSGHICNQFSGATRWDNGILRAPELASTNMLCSDEVNGIEQALFSLLRQGAKVTLAAERLTLSPLSEKTGDSNGGEGDAASSNTFVLQRENSVMAQ